MNKRILVKIGREFGADVLRILRAVPEFDVRTDPLNVPADTSIDAIVRFAGQETLLAVETRTRVNAATARNLLHVAGARPDTPLLLIANEITAEARQILADNDLAYIDEQGNAHLTLPGLLLRIAGTKRPPTKAPTRLSGKAGIVAHALLREPDRHWQIKDLVEATTVSAGFIHRVLARLTTEGVLATHGTGPRRTRTLTSPTSLLDLWAEEHNDTTTRELGYQLAQTNQQLVADLAVALDTTGIDYALTGAAAAAIIAPVLTSVAITELWVDALADPRDLIDQTPVDAVDNGHNVVFLQTNNNAPLANRQRVGDIWMADNLRIYLDLRNDPRRGAEQASNLREQIIGF